MKIDFYIPSELEVPMDLRLKVVTDNDEMIEIYYSDLEDEFGYVFCMTPYPNNAKNIIDVIAEKICKQWGRNWRIFYMEEKTDKRWIVKFKENKEIKK